MFHDDPLPARTEAPRLGEDLSGLSIEDLKRRREALQAEIARVDEALQGKTAGLDAAEAIFRSGR